MKSVDLPLFDHLNADKELRIGLVKSLNIFRFVDKFKCTDGLEWVVRITYSKLLYDCFIVPILQIDCISTL